MRRNPSLFFAGLAVGALALAGCTADATTTPEAQAATDTVAASGSSGYTELTYDELGIDEAAAVDETSAASGTGAVDVTLADGASSAAAGVSVDGDIVTITAAGTYRLSGTLTAGQVVVEVEEGQVNLILDGVDITSNATAAINVVNADAVVVYLAAGSTNTLSDAATTATATDTDTETETDTPNATLYSQDDLTITGTGSLFVKATVDDGITSKDTLIIAGGSITVDAVDDGVRGKDHIVVRDGTLTIKAGDDGIKADNDDILTDATSTKGVAWFEGGTVTITAGDDGVTAEHQVTVAGGDITINAADDGIHSEGVLSVSGGTIAVETSYEGLEGAVVLLSGGTASVVASDDGINAAGGYLEASSTTTSDGTATEGGPGGQRGEGPSGERPSRGDAGDGQAPQGNGGGNGGGMGGGTGGGTGGDATVTDPSELTVTTASGSGMGGMPGESSKSDRYLEISGGSFTVDAQGDGLDANGSFIMSGGTVVVAGPTSNGNSAVDVDGTYVITGGDLTASGSSGMLVTPDADASQGTVVAVFSGGVAAGSVITLVDASGTQVMAFTTERVSQSLIYSSQQIVSGQAYTVTVDGTEVGEVTAP